MMLNRIKILLGCTNHTFLLKFWHVTQLEKLYSIILPILFHHFFASCSEHNKSTVDGFNIIPLKPHELFMLANLLVRTRHNCQSVAHKALASYAQPSKMVTWKWTNATKLWSALTFLSLYSPIFNSMCSTFT